MIEDRSDDQFSQAQACILANILDQIIPPRGDGSLPGAGELGLAGPVERALCKTPELKSMIAQGLSDLDDLARRRHGLGFAALSAGEKVALLNEQGFLLPLIFQTYIGYYQHPRVVEALGLEPRPPHPLGYEMEPNDLSLLDQVRRRSKFYRQV